MLRFLISLLILASSSSAIAANPAGTAAADQAWELAGKHLPGASIADQAWAKAKETSPDKDGSVAQAWGMTHSQQPIINTQSLNYDNAATTKQMAAIPGQVGEWQKLRKALGLSPNNQLYVFVSLSMPESLLRAYQFEAAKAGASLVMRGIPKGQDLKTFIGTAVKGMFGPAGVQAPVQIDPRLFDRYQINTVPTIVLAKQQPFQVPCPDNNGCVKAPLDSYSSITGNVTLLYALQQFGQGGDDVAVWLDALKGSQKPSGDDKTEKAATAQGMGKKAFLGQMRGVWDRNSELLEAQIRKNGWEQYLQPYQTKWGKAFGPPGITVPDHLK